MDTDDIEASEVPRGSIEPAEALRDFSEQIAQLKRRRRELLELQEMRELQDEVAAMEQRLEGENPIMGTPRSATATSVCTSQDPDEPPAQRRRLDSDTRLRVGRGPKIEKIPVFEGKGLREYYDFETRLQIAFRLDPAAFSLEDQKIAFTLQYLQVTLRQLWIQRELEADGDTLGWRDMMSFLLDQIKSPVNRELQVTIQYQKATQKDGQSVNDFAAYLSTLENQINPPYEQKHLVMHLYSKLRPEIRIALSNYAEFPTTRRELVERAATLEDNLRRIGGPPSVTRRSGSGSQIQTPRFPRDASPRRVPRAAPSVVKSAFGQKPVMCHYCGRTGHWAKDCYKKKREQQPTTGSNAIQSKNHQA